MSLPEPASERPSSVRILLVDDHPMLRRGLAALIGSEAGLTVCAEAASVAEALAALDQHSPDLAIVDLALEKSDGLELLREMRLRHPRVPALVLSMHDEEVYGERALRAGARGYVSKQQLDDSVLQAIHQVLRGELVVSPSLQARLASKQLSHRTPMTDSPLDLLSDRELQVFRRLGEGRATRQVAEELGLSVKTIESHCANIKNKLGLTSAAELAHRAIQWVESGRVR
jgi:DNA-binding NarL/FixJ family response regulator